MKKIISFIILLLSLYLLTAESKRTESNLSDETSYFEADIILGFLIFCEDKGIQAEEGTDEYEALFYAYAYGYVRGYEAFENMLMEE